MRAYRNVNLNIGLMTLPVSIAGYTGESGDPRPSVVGPNGEELKQVYVQTSDDTTQVKFEDTKRSFDGKIVTQDELSQINDACKIKDLDILEVCDAEKIDLLRAKGSFYIFPNVKNGNKKVFKLFVEALRKMKGTAIVKWTPSSRQQLLALRPVGHAKKPVLMATALSFAGDVKEADKNVTDFQDESVSKQELDMATQLLESMKGDGSSLMGAIDEAIPMKRDLIDGKNVDIPQAKNQGSESHDLLADLQASVEEAEKAKS